jgi:hypothetical protein
MKIDHIYKLLKEKHNITEATIDGDENDFVIRSNDGQIFTNADFTKSELDKAKADFEAERAQLEADAAAAKASAKAKLEALGLTLDDLAALGL